MAAATFDPDAYKETTREQWQRAAEPWYRWGEVLEHWLEEASELMLDLAEIGTGDRVLDVAAGAGGQSVRAARRVGPSGAVLATDISPEILLSAVHRALKPGGHVASVNYTTPERNEFFSIPVAMIRERAGLPAPAAGQPGPFSLGADGVIETAYESAGFTAVVVRRVAAPLRLDSAAEYVRFARDSFGALHQMLAGLEEAEQEETWAEIEAAMRRFEGPDGFAGPCELVAAAARK